MNNEDLLFNPEKGGSFRTEYQEPPKSKLTQLIIKISGGKLDETKANYVLLGVLAMIVIATIIILYSNFGGESGGGAHPGDTGVVPAGEE